MIGIECSMDTYESIKICIGTIIRYLEILKRVPDHLKTKQMCKHRVKFKNYLIY